MSCTKAAVAKYTKEHYSTLSVCYFGVLYIGFENICISVNREIIKT